MAKTSTDFTKYVSELMSAYPVDMSSFNDAFKTQASVGEKMSKVALEAAEKSAEISSKWTKETLAKVADMTKAKAEPADYAKAMTDFASAQADPTLRLRAASTHPSRRSQSTSGRAGMSRHPAPSTMTRGREAATAARKARR